MVFSISLCLQFLDKMRSFGEGFFTRLHGDEQRVAVIWLSMLRTLVDHSLFGKVK